MKHLKLLIQRIYRYFYSLIFPEKALLRKREAERLLLISQLERSIGVNQGFRKLANRKEARRQDKNFLETTRKLELQRQFLDSIINCNIEEFEHIASKWMKKMGKSNAR